MKLYHSELAVIFTCMDWPTNVFVVVLGLDVVKGHLILPGDFYK